MNTEIFDFSNALMRCSGLYYLLCRGKEKSPKQKYEDLTACLTEEMDKYEDMGERLQGMKRGLSKAAKIAGLEQEIARLEPKKHEDPLPKGARSYLKCMYGELKYGKQSAFKDKGNKYTNKGKVAEGASLRLISDLDGVEYIKNEIRIDNDLISGIPDSFLGKSVYEADYVPDVKTSWSWDTFSENIGQPLNPLYWWQQQGYFALTGAKAGEVSYCLVNLPETQLNDEILRLEDRMRKQLDVIDVSIHPEYKLAEYNLINNMTFDNIPAPQRRLKFEVKRNDEAIQKIYDVVPKCREYLAEIQELHLTGYFSDKEPILDEIEEI